MEKVTAQRIRPQQHDSLPIVHMRVKMKFNSNSISTIYMRSKDFILKRDYVTLPNKGSNSTFTDINLHVVPCAPVTYGVSVYFK